MPPGIVAFNFNIAEAIDGFVIEICGAAAFDPDDPDWACDESWDCRPSQFEIPRHEFATWPRSRIK